MTQNLRRANFIGRSFRGEDLTGADFSYADIRGADFTGATLIEANFSHTLAGLPPRWKICLIAFSFLQLATLGVISYLVLASPFIPLELAPELLKNFIAVPGAIVCVVLWVFFVVTSQERLTAVVVAGAVVLVGAAVVTGTVAIAGGIAGAVAVGVAWALAGALAFAVSTGRIWDSQLFLGVWVLAYSGGIVFALVSDWSIARAWSLAFISCTLSGAVALNLAVDGALGLALAFDRGSTFWWAWALAIAWAFGWSLLGSGQIAMRDGALVWAVVVAVVVAVVMLVALLGPYIARQALAGEGFTSIRAVTLAVAAKGYTSFRGANLTNATFTQATLKNTDFREAILTGTSFANCHQLDGTLLNENPSLLALFRNQPTNSGVRLWLFVLGMWAILIGQQNYYAYFSAYSPNPLEIVASLHSSTFLQRVLIGHSDSSSDKTISPFGMKEYVKTVTSVAFSPDEQTLATGSWDKTIKLWDLRTGRLIRTLTGHSNWVLSVAISPDGQMIVSSSMDGTIKLWNLRTGQLIRTLTGLAVSADGQTLVTREGNTIKLWNLVTGELLDSLSSSGRVGSLTLSPDGQLLANRLGSGSAYLNRVELWNLRTGQLVRTLPERYWLHSVVISPDGQTLASVRGSTEKNQLALVDRGRRQIGIVELWDLRTGQLINTLAGHYWIESVAFSPSGQILAAGGRDNLVKVWNLYTGQLLCTLSTGDEISEVNSIAISPSGQILASGSSDGTIQIWRLPRH